jgi:hypothetical protein
VALADQINEALDKALSKIAAKITLDITADLQRHTPVDTGWARANWVPEIGQRPPETEFAGDKPSPEEVSQQAAISERKKSEIFSYRLNQGDIFISNNAPYIGKLNAGSSRQEPAGFVQRAIANALKRFG